MSSQICRSASKAAKSLLSSAKNARFFSEGRVIGAAAAVTASRKIPLYGSNFVRSSGSGVASKSWLTGLLALPAAVLIQDQEVLAEEVLAAEMERTFIAIKPDGVQRGLPRNMRGVKSCGMLLAASDSAHENVKLLVPPEGSVPGDRVWFGEEYDLEKLPEPAPPNKVQKKKMWESVQPLLKTDASGVLMLKEHLMRTSSGLVTSKSSRNANIS